MKPEPVKFVSNYPRGEYVGREVDLQAFKGLLKAYEKCSRVAIRILVANVLWIASAMATESFATGVLGWLGVTMLGLFFSDSLTKPLEVSMGEQDEHASRIRVGLALLAPLCLSLPLLFLQRRRIAREIQKYDRSLIGQLDSMRSSVLAMNILPPVVEDGGV